MAPPSDEEEPAVPAFYIYSCDRKAAGFYYLKDRLELITAGTAEDYHWRVIDDPTFNKKGSRGYYVFN